MTNASTWSVVVALLATSCAITTPVNNEVHPRTDANGWSPPARADVQPNESVPPAEWVAPHTGPEDLKAIQDSPPVAPPTASDNKWHWLIAPYLFAANVDGKLQIGNASVSTDVAFDDLVDNLDCGGFLTIEGKRGQWGFILDGAYIDLSKDGDGAAGVPHSVDMQMSLLEGLGAWRVTPTSPFEIVLGVRYLGMEEELQIGPASTDGSSDVVDGVIGGRVALPFAQRWRLDLYGDIGGGDSDRTWQALADIGYDFGGWGLVLGYRVLDYEFDDGAKSADFALEGWLFGAEFRF